MNLIGLPLISQLMRAIIVEDYAKAIEIITSEKFDPNETNESWGAPVLSAIISVVSTTDKFKDKDALKEVLKEIVKNDKFDPNRLDSEGETVLMHIARHPTFNWLIPFIINTGKIVVSIKNRMHRDVLDIAEDYGNRVMVDILLPFKIQSYKGMPKKRPGIKKSSLTSVKVSPSSNHNILVKLDAAFEAEAKKNPVSLYNLLCSFFKGEYDNCMQIVRDPNFNPNEYDKWEEPALSSFIYYSQDCNISYDEDMFKKIVDAIINNSRFNVNSIDSNCNTVLMVSMGFPKLNWLTDKLFNIQSARLDIINDIGESIREIADKCGNGNFYKSLVNKTFEIVESIN